MKSKYILDWVVLVVCLVAVNNVYAYTFKTCNGKNIKWNNNWTNMYISTTSFPEGSSWDSRLQNAMWHWNNVKGSNFNFYVGRDTDGTHSSSNGRNEVYLVSSLSDGAGAVTATRYYCKYYLFFGWEYGILETDIAFNNNKSWSTSPLDIPNLSSPFSFEGVALHELGHALGLYHEDNVLATMNSYYPNGGPLGHWKEWDPLGDDRLGARYLYGDGTVETDIAASVFAAQAAPGYSRFIANEAYVTRGTMTPIEFTFSNLSTDTKTFNISFYLSTNNYISTGDRYLGTNYGAWGSAGYTGTFTRDVYIPTDIAPETYYLGYIVDSGNAHAEANESNNYVSQAWQITIR